MFEFIVSFIKEYGNDPGVFTSEFLLHAGNDKADKIVETISGLLSVNWGGTLVNFFILSAIMLILVIQLLRKAFGVTY